MRLFSDLGYIIRVLCYSTVCAHDEVLRHSYYLKAAFVNFGVILPSARHKIVMQKNGF